MSSSVPTFIVGTGRCGSTMLSNMLREHPQVLSLSEFFGLVGEGGKVPEAFAPESMDGRRFWSIVASTTAPLLNFALRNRLPVPEYLYDCDAPAARFSSQTGVPAILVTTLPHLTEDCDALFSVLEKEVTAWPAAMIGEHYRHLFGWLAQHFGKRLWVERSGNIRLNEKLLALFPEARFVHLVRDGRDAAISMQGHLVFRLGLLMIRIEQCLGVHPLQSADRARINDVPTELRPFLPERFSLEAFLAFRIPLQLCGEFWAQEIDTGLAVLRALPADRLLTLRYEDFFVDPKRQLDALTTFLDDGLIDEEWSIRCAATVRKPKSSWRDLPAEEARALTEACHPGFDLLREAGVHYDF